jgi:indole-3-glycerol phosphate synthase/phosphoribosylanthranilate isomerase
MGRFRDALADDGLAAIAEFKRASPSPGDIRPDARVEEIVPAYTRAAAAAISVLVDARFAGSVDDLRVARAATDIPLLAKGFFSTREHLHELREAGADAALLILRDLDDTTCAQLLRDADELGLDALVEAHDDEELERAVQLDARVVGVNARDLSTFTIDRRRQLELVRRAPRDRVIVAESAIHTRAQGAAAELAGADAILVGSALMRAPDPAAKLTELISRPLVKVCGMTNQEDVDAALEAGADLVGFIFADGSPRAAREVLDVPDTALSVAVFVGEPEERGADLVQLYERAAGTVRGRDATLLYDDEPVARVLDLPWQEVDPEHLDRAAEADGRVVLAGKLGPDNVHEAIARVRPWAVDAASRLEREPGVKDHDKVRAFVEAAQRPVRGSGQVEGVGANREVPREAAR